MSLGDGAFSFKHVLSVGTEQTPTAYKSLPEKEESSQPHWKPLSPENVADVETFVFFMGWQRSGHSIIGSLLDGHPDVIIAHEFFLFQQWERLSRMRNRTTIFNKLYKNSFSNAQAGWRSWKNNQKGYNLELPNSWQGRFRKLRVIGDKTGGEVTKKHYENPKEFHFILVGIQKVVKVPIKVINVVRNPFDMIATLTLYRGGDSTATKVNATENNKFNDLAILKKATKDITYRAVALHQIQTKYELDLLRVYSEDFIRTPKAVMSEICHFLGLQCTEEYLQQCADKAFTTVSKSRYLVEWDPAIVSFVEQLTHTFSFFNRYSFDKD